MKQTECAPLEAHDFISGGAWMYHERIVKENEQLKTDLKKYKKAYSILSEYFDSISDEEQPKVAKRLEKLGLF